MLKKGEYSTSFIIKTILTVTAFAIVLFFLGRIVFIQAIEKQVCQQSVSLRSSLPFKTLTQNIVPLNCKTSKYCISAGSSKCPDDFGKDAQGVFTIKVKTKEQIEAFLAEELVSCWDMMGKGKASLFSPGVAAEYGLGSVYPTCIICSRIAFDLNSLQKAKILDNLSRLDVLVYMATHKIRNALSTYMDYLAGAEGQISLQKDLDIKNISQNIEQIKNNLGSKIKPDEVQAFTATVQATNSSNTDIEKIALEKVQPAAELGIVFMQISAPTQGGVFWNDLKTLIGLEAGSSYVFGFRNTWAINKWVGRLALKGGWYTVGAVLAFAGLQFGMTTYNRAVTAGYCGEFATNNEARNGCSAVKLINYNQKDVSMMCPIIESK